jgi:hypothetical protein
MKNYFCWDLEKVRAQGIEIAIGTRLTTGPLLRLKGLKRAARGLSNLVRLAKFAEVEIVGINGAPSTFITTCSLISKPQVIVGYHDTYGFPVLLGAIEVLKSHAALIGMTQGGKSTLLALIIYQLSRLGFPVFLISMKTLDEVLVASLKAACDSHTRLDSKGQLMTAPFMIYTLEPGKKTRGINVMPAIRSTVMSESAIRPILFRGLSEGGAERDPRQRFFDTFASAMLQRIPELGESLQELAGKLDALDQTQEEKRFGAGLQSEVKQQGSIEQANLPESHPSNIDILSVLKKGGAVIFDACFQDTGLLGTANAALVLLMIVQLKRKHMPSRDVILYLPIDESQKFNQELLKQLIEQLAGFGIRLILCYHNLEQLGENQETIGMTQVKFVFNANPGGETDKYLQSLHGTKTAYNFNHGNSEGSNTSESVTETSGPSGCSIGISTGSGQSQQSNCGFSETEKLAWPPNATLRLNSDPNLFVLSINPGAEFACYGTLPILCNRGGFHLTWQEVKELNEAALNSDPDAFIPGAPQIKLLPAPDLTPALAEQRARWSAILRACAENIHKKLS